MNEYDNDNNNIFAMGIILAIFFIIWGLCGIASCSDKQGYERGVRDAVTKRAVVVPLPDGSDVVVKDLKP